MPSDQTKMLAISRRYESITEVVARANEWIASEGVEPMSMETLLLPGAPTATEGTPTYIELNVGAISLAAWHQAVRVWYREPA